MAKAARRRRYRLAKNHKKKVVELVFDHESGVMVARKDNDEGPPERRQQKSGLFLMDRSINRGGVVTGRGAWAVKENVIDYLVRTGALARRSMTDREGDRALARYRQRAAEWVLQTHRRARLQGRTISLYHERSSYGVPEVTKAEHQARLMLATMYRKLGLKASDAVVDIVVFDHEPADERAVWVLCERLDWIAAWRQMTPKGKNSLQKSRSRTNAGLTRAAVT